MDVKVTDAGPCRKVLEVQAPPEAVAGEYAQTVRAFAIIARMPGFRPGKVPLQVVERQYAKQIAEEARDRLVPQFYHKALEQEGITPVAIVEVKDVVFAKASGLAFHVTVDVAPDFTLPKYKGIAIKAESVEITDAQVDEAVQRMRDRLARFETVSGRAAQANDLLRVDFTATVEGLPLGEVAPKEKGLGEARDFMVFLGEPEYLPGFTAGLTGAAVDETRKVDVTFPAEYPVAVLAGKHAAYTVTVKGIQERISAELTEAFFKNFGVDSEASLRANFRGQLEEGARRREEGRQKDEVARFLLEKTAFELPQSIVDRETSQTVRSMVQDISRRGATREQIVEQQESIVTEATRSSTERVKLTYILSRIAQEEKLAVEDADVESQLALMAERYQMPLPRLREELDKRDAMEGLCSDIRSEKALNFLRQEAKLA